MRPPGPAATRSSSDRAPPGARDDARGIRGAGPRWLLAGVTEVGASRRPATGRRGYSGAGWLSTFAGNQASSVAAPSATASQSVAPRTSRVAAAA
jgi:hypothetical protein